MHTSLSIGLGEISDTNQWLISANSNNDGYMLGGQGVNMLNLFIFRLNSIDVFEQKQNAFISRFTKTLHFFFLLCKFWRSEAHPDLRF